MPERYVLRWSDTGKQCAPRVFGDPIQALDLARAMARVAKKGIDVTDSSGNAVRSIRVRPGGEIIESAEPAAALA